MNDTTMEQPDAERFLAEPHVGVLAVAAPDGPPAAVPLWYDYKPGGEVRILTGPTSRKARLLAETRTATLVVDTVTPGTVFVSVELELVGSRPGTADDVRSMAGRYLEGAALDGYLAFAGSELEEDLYTFRPRRWRYEVIMG